MALHRSIHSNCETLKFNGENFLAWECQINTTLDFVFHTDRFLQGNNWNTLNADQNPAVVILLRSSVDRLLSTTVASSKQPENIFKSLCNRCKCGDRQYKVSLVNRLREFYGVECQESNDQSLAEFQEFYLELKQQNVSTEELFGLILQSVIKPPLNVDENAFRNNLNHQLNTTGESLSLDRVCQEITQVEGELLSGSVDNPIVINRLQRQTGRGHLQHQQKGKRPETPGKPSTFGTKALASALAFKGSRLSSSLMAKKGSDCNYCGCAGHWASTCNKLSSDLQSGKLDVTQLTAKAVPSGPSNQRPTQVRVRAVDMSEPHSDTVLIDSGASACSEDTNT
ncbi:hypothetical protein VP01_3497g2 [Puccinia sorghi]|uniref:Uncharacterized protein n=1 Tax=Puccinia sorghi TaxID=27349 RepID=A0A0L6UXQ0_9BASI|nr:hypothetical protein VP01_3497g2 [Puccinia sorghi]